MNLFSKYRNVLLATLLTAASFAPAARAQASVARIDVPFAFDCGSRHYAPGQYNIQMVRNGVVSIGNSAGSGLVMTHIDQSLRPEANGKAVFRIYGDRYFLRELWIKGEGTHFTFVQSKAEHGVQAALTRTSGSGMKLAMLDIPR